MRRSCAPSVKKAEKRKLEPYISENVTNKQRKEDLENVNKPTNSIKGNKIVFNIQWREQSKKKHKTWTGDGILEVQIDKNRAVLLDNVGKYLGSSGKLKISDLSEGYEMCIANKDVQLLDQIKTENEYWAARKVLSDNRGWGSEEWQPSEETVKVKNIKPILDLSSKIQLGILPSKCVGQQITLFRNRMKHCDNDINKGLQISENLLKHLRPHQREGVAFMYEYLLGFKENEESHGCILADEMGLGKTIQVLTVSHSLLRCGSIQRILIIAPRSLVSNWDNEIHKWLQMERMYAFIVDSTNASNNRKKLSSYAKQIHMPFVIVSYETLLSQMTDFQLLNFDLLICDEGHRLKNPDTKTYKNLKDLNIKRCILVSGTPVQNVLKEFFALADFVNPGIFGTSSEFRRYYEIPIEQGQLPSACEETKTLAAERTAKLKAISSTFMLRRSQNINLKYLPKKREYICFICPTKLQHLLLKKAIKIYNNKNENPSGQTIQPLEIIGLLRKICNHPVLLQRSKKANSEFIKSLTCYFKNSKELSIEQSSKLCMVECLLRESVLCHEEKVILVSYHTKTLDMLQELCEHLSLKHLRLDGSTSSNERNSILKNFNSENSNIKTDAFILLLSAKAGGVGLNLIGASRLIIYDIDWNPANDAQALSRIWREGQKKNVHIYRFIMAGCIEEKIFQRQVTKTNLGEFVLNIDDTNVSSLKFSIEELQDLCYLQYDYNVCDTHQNLKCNCNGDGQNLININEIESRDTKQINALMKWKHWKQPFEQVFMQEACLSNSDDKLTFMFTSDTEIKT